MVHFPTVKSLQKLQAQLDQVTAILISRATHITYLTGFRFLLPEEREALLLVTNREATLLHANFSPVDISPKVTKVAGCNVMNLKKEILKLKNKYGINNLKIDEKTLFVDELNNIRRIKKLKISSFEPDLVWQLRIIKNTEEQLLIKKASEIATEAMSEVLSRLELGTSEIAVAKSIESRLEELGSEKVAFPTIVAFGKHTTLPHHQPTSLTLKKNQPVLIDMGATYGGYRSDITKTTWFGKKTDADFTKIETVVMEAFAVGVNLLKSGAKVRANELDLAVRNHISGHGFGESFIHTTGHGVGLDIHEKPSISWMDETVLESGMVITIEPGIYLENKFGFRYEETVVVGDE